MKTTRMMAVATPIATTGLVLHAALASGARDFYCREREAAHHDAGMSAL
jgi:hypothetical protein